MTLYHKRPSARSDGRILLVSSLLGCRNEEKVQTHESVAMDDCTKALPYLNVQTQPLLEVAFAISTRIP